MTSAIDSDAAIAALRAHWVTARSQPEIADQRTAAHFYSSESDIFVLMRVGFHSFNGLVVALEDGQLFAAKGSAPKATKGQDLLKPAKNLRRGRPLGTRNVTNPEDARWAMCGALATGGRRNVPTGLALGEGWRSWIDGVIGGGNFG